MIPRKRLQALLYILQIFYVFGDGDPGREGLAINELQNNVIDDDTPTTEAPSDHHLSLESIVPSEKTDRSDHKSNKLHRLHHPPKKNISLDLDTDIDSVQNNDSHIDKAYSAITNLKVDDVNATSVNISWKISGHNSSLYHISLFKNEGLVESYNTSEWKYCIKNLKPCSDYKIGVSSSPYKENETEIVFVNTTTSFLKPGEPPSLQAAPGNFSLHIEWKEPEIGDTCVKYYRVNIDNGQSGNRDIRTDNTTALDYKFENLYACTVYQVQVIAVDRENGDSKPAILTPLPTYQAVAKAPTIKSDGENAFNKTKTSISINWDVSDDENNCPMHSVFSECNFNRTESQSIELFNGNGTLNITDKERPKNLTVVVQDLSPFTYYICKAKIINEAGESNWSAPIEILTDEDVPPGPQNFKLKQLVPTLVLSWEKPLSIPGKLIKYVLKLNWTRDYPVPDRCNLHLEKTVDKLDPGRNEYELPDPDPMSWYSARLFAATGAGLGEESLSQFYTSIQGVPDKVTDLKCTVEPQRLNPDTFDTELSWGLPCASKGYLNYFEVDVTGKRDGYPDHNILDTTVNVTLDVDKNQIFRVNFGELKPLYTYTFEVAAMAHGTASFGEIANTTIVYPPGIPPQPNPDYFKSITLDPIKARKTTSTASILLPIFPEDNGKIKYYAVMVARAGFYHTSLKGRFNLTENKWPNVSSWEESMEKNFEIPYQATEPKWDPYAKHLIDYGNNIKAVKFIVGEDQTCTSVSANTPTRVYCNGPLKPDSWYEVRMRAYTENGFSESEALVIKTNRELNVSLVLGVVLGILSIGMVTTLMLLVKRCSPRLMVQRFIRSNIPESPVPNPFTRRKFLNHCQQLADSPGKLSNEFQLLQTLSIDLQMPSNTACLQANRKKNRYSDILPYDFSRVKLEVIDDDPNTDYINASFIKGYSGHEEYIACQGPKEDTTYDFWRMIDQYDVKIILMLTQLVERGKEKCHQYFPTIKETFNYENLSIKCTSELDYRTYTQRTLVLQKGEEKRTITHLYFKDWPDHDVPDDFDAMIHFCQIFRKQFSCVKGLAVVHCSAGIGRTGTLIAVDILLQSIRDNRKLDVFGTVYRLRRHRLNMVQRESQYAYIYNCIRQVLKNPYFFKTCKPPPVDPIHCKNKVKKERSDSSTELVDSVDTLRKNSSSTSIDSMQPLCKSSPQTTPKIQMNVLFAGLRYCKSTSAIDTRSNHNRMGRYNSEGYALCGSERDSSATTSKESIDEIDTKSSSSSLYENVETLIRPSSSQTMNEAGYYLTNDSTEKDTSL
ncbi:hypothetical protein QAD02_011366 [Eretmocerus hayati]|uniref:Uncharacterized protein n=1 Tax=Eretmocerus hayati TaxID=131215 RepID=A0ACC2NW98_9HYME|nr:hypothetical protein QAD02_011366 [Eretmocerus hayati]